MDELGYPMQNGQSGVVAGSSWLNLKSWRLWLGILAAATVIGLIEGTQVHLGMSASGRAADWSRDFASTMPSWYVLAALLPAIIWVARRFPMEPSSWRRNVAIHMGVATLFAAVHISTSAYISDYLLYHDFPMPFAANLSRLLGIYFVIELFFYWALVGGYYIGVYWQELRDRERLATQLALKTSRLETSLTRAHLEALRMQLNPHFLFNTLNAISVLAMKGEKHTVVRTLTLLSDLLRASLESSDQTMSLREEIALLQRYLEIEQTRFKDRLAVRFDVPDELLDAEVPTLVLQPLVENAIRHGISQKPGVGRVDVRARSFRGRLILEVQDSGPGVREQSVAGGTGIGLANTRARLEQLYGAEQKLELCNAPEGGALVRIEMPLRVSSGEIVNHRGSPVGTSRSA